MDFTLQLRNRRNHSNIRHKKYRHSNTGEIQTESRKYTRVYKLRIMQFLTIPSNYEWYKNQESGSSAIEYMQKREKFIHNYKKIN